MDPKSLFTLLAIIISIISLYISCNVAWVSHFKPAEIKGTFPHLVIWTMSSYKDKAPTGEIARRHIAPSLWIGNSGAKSILIEDIRLVFITPSKEKIAAYPISKIPSEAIESPSIFHDYEKLNLGGPFLGFSLSSEDGWKSSYSFAMKEEFYHKLKGNISVEVQVIEGKKQEWRTILQEVFDFGTNPIHLQGLISVSGHKAGVLINHVTSSSWNQRRAKTGL